MLDKICTHPETEMRSLTDTELFHVFGGTDDDPPSDPQECTAEMEENGECTNNGGGGLPYVLC